jgi:hypothetical protein
VTPGAAELIAAAQQRTGLRDFDGDSFHEGLELLLAGMAGRSDYTGRGRAMLGDEFGRYLDNRLRVADYLRSHPEVRDAPIASPVIILGMPRTGTTAISYLFDCDPQWRSLLQWEAVYSVPPPTTATLRSDPRCVELKRFQEKVLPALPVEPPHWEWADAPTECIFVQSQDFKSLALEARVPFEPYAEFVLHCDMTSAYDYHRTVLQILQSRAPGRWVLKMPSHALHIRWALAAYPDARFVWTHRDPFAALASLCSTIAFGHASVLRAPDLDYIRRIHPRQIAEHVNRAMAVRDELPSDRFHDLFLPDFLRDPIGELRRIYRWLGAPLSLEVEARMRAWLAADGERQARRPRYALEDYGLTRAAVAPLFEEYLERFPSLSASRSDR